MGIIDQMKVGLIKCGGEKLQIKKGQPGALKLLHMQSSRRGHTILVYCTQPCPVFYTRDRVPGLEPT